MTSMDTRGVCGGSRCMDRSPCADVTNASLPVKSAKGEQPSGRLTFGVNDRPVKNTFIHFDVRWEGRDRSLRRAHSAECFKTGRASWDGANVNDGCADCELPQMPSAQTPPRLEGQTSAQTPPRLEGHALDKWPSPEKVRPRASAKKYQSAPAAPLATCSSLNDDIEPLSKPVSTDNYFEFTLRLAPGTGLGLQLAQQTCGIQPLLIMGIEEHGAVAAWNEQCLTNAKNKFKVLSAGDAIICVNGKADHVGMLRECRTKILLKLTIFHVDLSDDGCENSMQTEASPHSHSHEGERLHGAKKQVELSNIFAGMF